jgi:putative spermidine/putrescine transport system substrate-binding protein
MRSDGPDLRVLGTKETLLEPIRQRAEQDLGIRVHYAAVDGMTALQQAIVRPDSFDVYDHWHTSDLAWTARVIQPISTARIDHWDDIGQLSLTGRFDPWSTGGQGDIPGRQLWVQADNRLGEQPTKMVSMVPTVHNADSAGFLPIARELLGESEPESWAWLLDDRLNGRVAIMRDPSIGIIECALSAQASGLATFGDLGNLSIGEIDDLIEILIAKKRANHFAGFWSTYQESVRLVESGEVVLQSIWSPAITALRARNWPMKLSQPREGSRGWHAGLCISSRVNGRTLDLAYAYINWWLDGWVGAQLSRQGYYMSIPERTHAHLTPVEWAYWYLGEPAGEDIKDNDGCVVAHAGERREGGSYRERMSRIAVWNSFMDEHNYLVRRWSEFMRA